MKRWAVLGGLVVFVLAAGVGWATIVQDSVVYRGCYGSDGYLRIVEPGVQCKKNETSVTWNQQGPPGVAGPTSLTQGSAEVANSGSVIVTHTVTDAEAGLNLMTGQVFLNDIDSLQGGVTRVECSLVTGWSSATGGIVTLHDTGVMDLSDATVWSVMRRETLDSGTEVVIYCQNADSAQPGGSGVYGRGQLMLERVNS